MSAQAAPIFGLSLDAPRARAAAWKLPAGIMALAFVLRMALFLAGPAFDVERAFEQDSYRYVELGVNLESAGVFGRHADITGDVHIPLATLRERLGQIEPRDGLGLRPEIFRTPGYPVLIASVLRAGLPLAGLLMLQCLLAAVNVGLVYALAHALGLHRQAWLASLLVALNPADILTANAVLSETPFTTLMLAGLWLGVRHRGRVGPGALGAGALFGLSVLVRPVSILLGPAVAIWWIATDRKPRTVLAAALLTAASLLPPAAWMARNHAVGFGWRISSVPTINALYYTAGYTLARSEGKDPVDAWPATVRRLHAELAGATAGGTDAFDAMAGLSRSILREHPGDYAAILARSAGKFFLDHSAPSGFAAMGIAYQPSGIKDRLLRGDWSLGGASLAPLAVAGAWTLLNAALALGMFAGLGVLAWRRQWVALLLLGGIMAYFLLTVQANGLERFRVPVLGVQAIAVAACLIPPRRGEAREITAGGSAG